MNATTETNAPYGISKQEVKKLMRRGLENLTRSELKNLHTALTGKSAFGLKYQIVEAVESACEDYLEE